jgi:hypothetical protein
MDQLAGVQRLPWTVAPLLEQLLSYQHSLYRTVPGTQLGRSHADCGCSQWSPITVVVFVAAGV